MINLKYNEIIRPYSIEGVDISNIERATYVYHSVSDWLDERTYPFHNSSIDLENEQSYDEFSGFTRDGIIIHSGIETRRGTNGKFPINKRWEIELFSSVKPLDRIKENLVQAIKKYSVSEITYPISFMPRQ